MAAHVSGLRGSTEPSPLTQHARQIYKLPQSSLAELARNSVVQSGFEMEVKRHWLGQKWYLPGAAGNDINKVSRSPYRSIIGTYVLYPLIVSRFH